MKTFKQSSKYFIFCLIAILAIIFLNGRNQISPVKDFFYSFFSYPQKIAAGAGLGFGNIGDFFQDTKDLREENRVLLEENNKIKKEIFELKEIRRENDMLRSFLDLPQKEGSEVIDADVIGKDPYSFSKVLAIRRGSADGVKAGMIVIDSSGFFVGKIAEASSGISKIITAADPLSSIGAIDQETRVQGLVKSELNSGLIFDMVAQDNKIEINDTIIIPPSAESVSFYPIAKVVSVEKFPNKTFQNIKISLLADIKNIEKVFIVLK